MIDGLIEGNADGIKLEPLEGIILGLYDDGNAVLAVGKVVWIGSDVGSIGKAVGNKVDSEVSSADGSCVTLLVGNSDNLKVGITEGVVGSNEGSKVGSKEGTNDCKRAEGIKL